MRFAGKKLWLALAVLGVSGSALAQSTGEFASDGRRAEASPLKAVFWVERGSGELAVLALKLSHPDLIEAAYGTARLPGVFNAAHERLTKAFPDAIWLVEPEQLRIFALLGRSERAFEAQVLRAQVAQAFSWPLELDGASLEVDLSLGVACYGADGTQADALKALAAERATALE